MADSFVVARQFCFRYGSEVIPLTTESSHSSVHLEEKAGRWEATVRLHNKKNVSTVCGCHAAMHMRTADSAPLRRVRAKTPPPRRAPLCEPVIRERVGIPQNCMRRLEIPPRFGVGGARLPARMGRRSFGPGGRASLVSQRRVARSFCFRLCQCEHPGCCFCSRMAHRVL